MSMKKITIGVTFSETRYENFPKWIKGDDEDIEIHELSWKEQNWEDIESCDAILLTGGVDIHPQFYGSEVMDYPLASDFNIERDEFEMHVFETALNLGHPILAICRGHQLVNVALGGDLIQDLQAAGKLDHRRQGDTDTVHTIAVTEGTLLHQITGQSTGTINSAHHQATHELSEELMPNSYSPDGVVEGAEWRDKEGKPWLLCVQWHPERMLDKETSPFAHHIREAFLEAARG